VGESGCAVGCELMMVQNRDTFWDVFLFKCGRDLDPGNVGWI
jgi:hypothetical protein